jgi:hypothetical protein
MADQSDPRSSDRSGLKSNAFTTAAVVILALISVLFTITLLGSFSGKSPLRSNLGSKRPSTQPGHRGDCRCALACRQRGAV